MKKTSRNALAYGLTTTLTIIGLSGCTPNWDLDLRDKFGGMDTTQAARNATIAPRQAPDARGVITYSDYQVAVARSGDTVETVANRLNLSPNVLASLNKLQITSPLRKGEIIALPKMSGSANTEGLQATVVDVSELGGANTKTPNTASEPVRHIVELGETAFTIARLYDIPVQSLVEWNRLNSNMELREGQSLLIPVKIERPTQTAIISAPGVGSESPLPPSSSRPQPVNTPVSAATSKPQSAPPVVDLKPATTQSRSAMSRPVSGSIIRGYKRGKNEGIDIGAPAGTPVKAASAGRVTAISQDTKGVMFLLIQHDNNLLTIYTNISGISVKKGDNVQRGQTIAKVAAGSPSFLHFEIRKGMESQNPDDFL